MIGNVSIEPERIRDCRLETPDLHQLAQENGCLRVIIAELLMKNQHLRWALNQGVASDGTPLWRNSRTAATP
jgi:hypothetical protein